LLKKRKLHQKSEKKPAVYLDQEGYDLLVYKEEDNSTTKKGTSKKKSSKLDKKAKVASESEDY
jgi:hypothetical protein